MTAPVTTYKTKKEFYFLYFCFSRMWHSQSIKDYPNPSTRRPEFQDFNNGMEVEDTKRYQLMSELMNWNNELNTSVEQLIAQRELQNQIIELEIVEPPSPKYNSP